MNDIENIIEIVKLQFSRGCPNDFLLGWDRDRFYASLTEIFINKKIINQTDFNYSYCNSYEIFLEEENDKLIVLEVQMSFICKAFNISFLRCIAGKKRSFKGKVLKNGDSFEQLRSLLFDTGFREIHLNEFGIEIDEVSLELTDTATLGKCLFDDYY